MRFPFNLALALTPKARLTALGIAICVIFVVASFGFVGTVANARIFNHDYPLEGALVIPHAGTALNRATFPVARATFVEELQGTIDGMPCTFLHLDGPEAPGIPDNEVRLGSALAFAVKRTGQLKVSTSAGAVVLLRGPTVENKLTPTVAAYLPAAVFQTLSSNGAHAAAYAILRAPTPSELDTLARQGYEVVGSPSLPGFFAASASEIGTDLWLLLAFGSVIIALLCFEFLSLEVRERRREIGIWRSIGMRRRHVLGILLAQTGLLCVIGSISGAFLAMGGLVAMARVLGASARIGLLPAGTTVLILATVLLAALAGGFLPAWRAAHSHIATTLEEPT